MSDPWFRLRQFTPARIAQGIAGCSQTTAALLDFQLAHASARDAVHQTWAAADFASGVEKLGLEPLMLATRVIDRQQYLQRPDLGRCLAEVCRPVLEARAGLSNDVAVIVSNGLSSKALDNHGLALLEAMVAAFALTRLRFGPVCLVPNGRVALADEIGALLNARLTIIIVGERPGLSAADSLGAYLTYSPKIGNTDAERNCISNIRPPHGLDYLAAAAKLAYLAEQAIVRGFSGVMLKDDMPELKLAGNSELIYATNSLS
jgi:ethanolamine ammonia-lyase small subunit